MALEQRLSLKLAQKLVMTPSLQQAIKLLQMTRLELQGVLSQELVENPILEESGDVDDDSSGDTEAEEAAPDDNSMENIDFEAYFGDYMEGSGYASVSEERQAAPLENTVSETPDLYSYLGWQLHMLSMDRRQRELTELIVGNLNGDGFLVATLEELREQVPPDVNPDAFEPYSEEEVKAALAIVRSLDPPGIACWELPESLLLQLEHLYREAHQELGMNPANGDEEAVSSGSPCEDGDAREMPGAHLLGNEDKEESEDVREDLDSEDQPGDDEELEDSEVVPAELSAFELACYIVTNHWQAFFKRQFLQLAKELDLDLEELRASVDLIRSLEPHPGRRFSSERPQYIEPDVTVLKVSGEYVIQLDDDGMPRLRISKAYRLMLSRMRKEGDHADAQQYIKDKMRSALWLIKSLDQRQRTIYKVADSILRQQRAFFDHGIDHLRPMVLRDVAEDIGMHESTVSRVVANKYIHTPRGLFPLKFFFHSGIDRDYGENISSLTVKRKIEHLVQAENPKKPLSDSELMRILKRDGIQIARRTVAKYRDELAIPSSTDRKKVFL